MKRTPTFRNPFSFRCLTIVLFAVLFLQTVSVAQLQFFEDFEGYEVGTAGEDTSIGYFYGFNASTVADGGPERPKELCFARGSSGGFGFLDTITPIPLRGSGTVLTSYDFRIQLDETGIGLPDNEVTLTTLIFWESIENFFTVGLRTTRTMPVQLSLWIANPSDAVFENLPLSDFNFRLEEPAEWSDYYSLQVEVRFDFGPGTPLTGVAVAKLVDTAGNVLLSTTKEVSSFPFSQATGTVEGPRVTFKQNNNLNILTKCYDNFSHSVTFVAASEPVIGDVNQDVSVDFSDIAPFISLLQSGTYLDEADINRDGAVNFLDIAPFIEALASQ